MLLNLQEPSFEWALTFKSCSPLMKDYSKANFSDEFSWPIKGLAEIAGTSRSSDHTACRVLLRNAAAELCSLIHSVLYSNQSWWVKRTPIGDGYIEREKVLADLYARLQKIRRATCPFVNLPQIRRGRWDQGITPAVMKDCQWVEPVLVAQVKFTEWTSDDQLRQPAFLGLRPDKRANENRRAAILRGNDPSGEVRTFACLVARAKRFWNHWRVGPRTARCSRIGGTGIVPTFE